MVLINHFTSTNLVLLKWSIFNFLGQLEGHQGEAKRKDS